MANLRERLPYKRAADLERVLAAAAKAGLHCDVVRTQLRGGVPSGPRYIDRIVKGAKPAELPAEQPTQYYLAVNLKTAATLGLTFPPSLVLRTDEVVQ